MSNKIAMYTKESTDVTIEKGDSCLIISGDGTKVMMIMAAEDTEGMCNEGATAVCALGCLVADEEAMEATVEAYIGD